MTSFPEAARPELVNVRLRTNLLNATDTIRAKRAGVVAEVPDWEELREAGRAIKADVLVRLDEFPAYARFLFEDVEVDAALLDGGAAVIAAAREALAELEPFTAESIEAALRRVLEALGLKPRQGFQPIRIAVTGSKVSPGLFESIELLGRERVLERLSAAGS